MLSSEERITELEHRVAHLEDVVKKYELDRIEKSRLETSNIAKPGFHNTIFVQNEAANDRPVEFTQRQLVVGMKQDGKQEKQSKDKEALVGKYIVGALAAVLIFIGTISFISLVWNRMTPEIKLFLISLAGSILTGFGFWLIRTRKNPITSIILGTGAGLLFIAILSADLAFHMIGNNMAILLAGIWAVLFIVSSRYTNLFFTTIIAYIGSYITLILGLMLLQGDTELLLLIVFTSAISAVMIYTTLKKKKVEFITGILLSFLSFTTILIRCYMDGLLGAEQLLDSYVAQMAVIVIIYLLMNIFYKEMNHAYIKAIPAHLGVGAVTSISTILFINYISHNYFNLKAVTCYALFFIINLIQFTLNNICYKKIELWLTRYYAVLLVFASMLINVEVYKVPTGIIIIGILLIVSEKVFKREHQGLLIGIIIFLDSLLLLFNYSDNLICSVYGLLQIGLMGYVLYKNTGLKNYTLINTLKTFGVIVIIINSFGIPTNIINFINAASLSKYVHNAIGYMIAVIVTIILLKIGYFKDWKSDEFNFFGKNDTLKNDKSMQVLIYLLSTGLYFYGLKEIADADKPFLQLLFTFGTIAIAFIQSKIILLGNGRNKPLIGIWIVIKYLMLTWTILWAFLDLDIVSVAYSIVGLIVALCCISAGFILRNRNIRLYGLVLTIIMVAKFILVDLNQENSIIRVLALIAGGGLCFVISLIYNKLSENYS
jgi:hypothetical protein